MLISVTEATSHILYAANRRTYQEEFVSLDLANGRITTNDIHADRDYPPYDRVMMDGICTSSRFDTSQPLTLAGTINAGDSTQSPLKDGEAWRINTGAALPSDCDLIIPIEELSIDGDQFQISTNFRPQPYQFVHKLGSDTKAGEVVLPKGSQLNSATLSIPVSVGMLSVSVRCAPKVCVLTTGQEAIRPDQSPTPLQIRRSHPTVIRAALSALGIHAVTFHHLEDDEASMRSLLEAEMQQADVILTCGAISKGSSDFLGKIFRDLLGDPIFHGVAQRPGKPLAFWDTMGKPLVFALPGNALSTLITFHRYVAPALRTMMEQPVLEPARVTISHDLPDFHLGRFLPVKLNSPTIATLLNPQNSGDFSQLAGSDGFVQIPHGTPPASPTTLPFYPWL